MRSHRYAVPKLVLCLVATTTCIATGCNDAHSNPPSPGPPTVSTVTIEAQPVTLSTELPGRTVAYRVAEIRPQVNGIILERPFTEGDDVAAGDLLYQIDPAPYQAAYDQAEAALAVAKSQLPALRSRADRLRKMAEVRAAGKQDADDAEAALQQAEANVAAAEASLAAARVNLAYTPMSAPISGRIGRSAVTVGALVTAYQPQPLAVIQQLDPIYVDVTQATAELLRLRHAEGSGTLKESDAARTVTLLLEDGSTYPHEGTLEFRDVTVDPSTGSVTLRMVFPNPHNLLLPGMYVRAVVEEGVRPEAVLAPQQGITRDQRGRPIALVVGPDSAVEQRLLVLDRAIDDSWLVSSGLEPGDRLIVEGLLNVRPGMSVHAVPFSKPPQHDTAGSSAAQPEPAE